jgi:uncharacterized membrane protein
MMARVKAVTRYIFGVLFVLAGVNHFVNPEVYMRIMPPYLPWHFALVLVSGVAEVVLGALLLLRRCAAFAGWGLIALLIAIFPANLHMALNPELFPRLNPTALWLRLPLQGVLVAWAYWYARDSSSQRLANSH